MLFDPMAHFRHLERILRRRGRSHEEAQDLIQESFLRVQVYLKEGGQIREPRALLVRTALDLSRDLREREHRELYATRPVEELVLHDTGPTQMRLRRLRSVLNG